MGVIELSFDYKAREIPDFDIEQSYNLALEQCEQWGYISVNQSDELSNTCVSIDGNKCIRHRNTIKYQCY